MIIKVTKKPAKSDKRPVLGSKLSSSKPSMSTISSGKKATSTLQTFTKASIGNALDSTAPAVRRGKEREKPKKKRPSKMRKIITAEKAAKKMSQTSNLQNPATADVAVESEDKNVTESEGDKGFKDEKSGAELTEISEVKFIL